MTTALKLCLMNLYEHLKSFTYYTNFPENKQSILSILKLIILISNFRFKMIFKT